MLTITRPVLVKVRVTDSYKKDLAQELQQAVSRLELELRQLELQGRKLEEMAKKNPGGVEAALAQLEQEKQKRLDKRFKLLDNIKEIGRLSNGTEVLQGKVESIVEVNTGDDWQQLMSTEIIIEDGKVAEIRTVKPEANHD